MIFARACLRRGEPRSPRDRGSPRIWTIFSYKYLNMLLFAKIIMIIALLCDSDGALMPNSARCVWTWRTAWPSESNLP